VRLRRLAQRIIEAVANPHTESAVADIGIGPEPVGLGLGAGRRGMRHALRGCRDHGRAREGCERHKTPTSGSGAAAKLEQHKRHLV
jgi:hypothetical protein